MEEITFPQIEEQPVSWGYYRDLHDAKRYKAIVDQDILSQNGRIDRRQLSLLLEGVVPKKVNKRYIFEK